MRECMCMFMCTHIQAYARTYTYTHTPTHIYMLYILLKNITMDTLYLHLYMCMDGSRMSVANVGDASPELRGEAGGGRERSGRRTLQKGGLPWSLVLLLLNEHARTRASAAATLVQLVPRLLSRPHGCRVSLTHLPLETYAPLSLPAGRCALSKN